MLVIEIGKDLGERIDIKIKKAKYTAKHSTAKLKQKTEELNQMQKQKTNKSILKRFKITSKGKLLRRHQLGAGHLKRNKTKGALERHKKTSVLFAAEAKKYRKVLGI